MVGLRKSILVGAVALGAFCSVGCGKVKSLLGKGDDGGAGQSSGGGLLGLGSDDGLGFLTSFEGQVDLTLQGKMASQQGGVGGGNPGDTTNVSLLVKDKKLRAELPASASARGPATKGFVIVDAPARKAFVVTDSPEKMALVFEFDKIGEQVKGFSGGGGFGRPNAPAAQKPPPKVTKTGKTDKVAGYTCEEWEVQSEDNKMSLCVAKKGFSWLQIPLAGAGSDLAWAGELLDGSHVPLRAIMFEKGNPTKEAGRVFVTKIEKKTLAASQFEVPPGYPQMTLEQMIAKAMSGFGGAGGKLPPGALPPGIGPAGAKQPKGAKPPASPF